MGKLRAKVAAWRHGNPSRSLKIIGVAGAHGKTTTVLLLGEMLQESGKSVITLTNHGCFHNGQPLTDRYDTSADALQHILSVARKKEVDFVIIEVTDAFVATHVLPTLLLEMSVITNDSPCAQALLNEPVNFTVVPSGFDVAGLSVAPHQAINFGEDETAEAQIVSVTERRKGTEIDLVIDHQTKLSVATYLIGKANALNVAAAVSAAYVLAADTATFEEGIARLERVAGNYDYIDTNEAVFDIVVDAATDEASIELVLSSAYALKRRRLLVVADGSISSESHPMMKLKSDRLIVVSDGPEVPGVEKAQDEQAAFELVKRGAKKDDVVVLVGARFARRQPDGATQAHKMVEAHGE